MREHYATRNEVKREGICARQHCRAHAQPGSAYCSVEHDLDDDWTLVGY